MEISLKVPEEIAARARARGMSVEAYVQELLAQAQVSIETQNISPKTAPE